MTVHAQKIRAVAIIYFPIKNGLIPVAFDVSKFTLNYQLNKIPTAEIYLNVGQTVESGNIAPIFTILNISRFILPIQVLLKVISPFSGAPYVIEQWPPGYISVFEGYIGSSSYAINASGSSSFKLSAVGWLDDLHFSSALSRTSFVSNPSHYFDPALVFLHAGAGGGANKAWAATALGLKSINADVIINDLWGGIIQSAQNQENLMIRVGGLKNFLYSICMNDVFFMREIGLLPGQLLNYEAIGALNRFEPLSVFSAALFKKRGRFAGYEYGMPVGMFGFFNNRNMHLATALAVSIAKHITKETIEEHAGTTLWEKIVNNFCSIFALSLVPMVDRALIVPFVPGLGGLYWKTIAMTDYWSMSMSDQAMRPLRGIAVTVDGPVGRAGAFNVNPGLQNTTVPSVGGFYLNPFAPSGMIKVVRGPEWISNSVPIDLFTKDTTVSGIISNALYPNAGKKDGDLVKQNLLNANAIRYNVANSYAYYVYLKELFANREITVSGRLRLDIAPGSSVVVNIPIGPSSVKSPNLAWPAYPLYGQVSGLTVSVDGEVGTCSTTFALNYVMNFLEHFYFRMFYHPIWGSAWYGAPLYPYVGFLINAGFNLPLPF